MSADGKKLLLDAVSLLASDDMMCGDYSHALVREAKTIHLEWFRDRAARFCNLVIDEIEKRNVDAHRRRETREGL